jgi:hypothetical protein
MRYSSLSVCVLIGSSLVTLARSDARISETARNLLLDARISSNIESLDRGLRGGPDHMIFDLQQGAFATPSQWHEYGVGFQAQHVFTRTGPVEVGLRFSDGEHTDRIRRTVTVLPPVEARIVPLTKASMAGQPVAFSAAGSVGSIREYKWDFGGGVQASGRQTQHVFAKPGIYRVALTVTDGTYADTCPALVRVHTEETVGLPQLLLDTDAKNEQDDQHYLGYLKSIMPARNKALYDASCLSAIISDHLGLGWVKKTEPVIVAGPDQGYRWTGTAQPTPVQVIRQIDQQAMQRDLFESMKGRPTRLLGRGTQGGQP